MRWLVIVRDGVKSAAVLEDLGRMLDDFKPTREQGGDVWSVGIGKAAEPWFANEVAWGATTLDAAGTPRQAIMGALGATKPGVAAKCVKEWTAKAGR